VLRNRSPLSFSLLSSADSQDLSSTYSSLKRLRTRASSPFFGQFWVSAQEALAHCAPGLLAYALPVAT
jgi:hypothetical protein